MKKVSFRNDILPMKNNLYRLALRITCNNAEAEDVVQDTLIKVWNRRERWDEIESMEAFCMTICRNLALDKIKKMGNQHDSLDDNQQDRPSALNNPYEEMNQKDRIQLVRRIVDELPVCGNVCQHVSVCRLSEKGGNNRKKEKTDRTVALLGYSG